MLKMLQKLDGKVDQSPNPKLTKKWIFGRTTDASTNGKITAHSKDGRIQSNILEK